MKAQDFTPAHVGAKLGQERDSSVKFTQGELTMELGPHPASPELWAARQRPLPPEAIKLRQCKLDDLCLLAPASRQDICARLARIAPRENSSRGGDAYRADGRANAVQVWQQATILEDASTPHPEAPARGDLAGGMRPGGGKIQCRTIP